MAEAQQNEDRFSGQVIIGDDNEQVGDFQKSWIISSFEPYPAEITIKKVIDFSKVQFVEMNNGDIVLARGISDEYTFSCINVKTGIFCTWIKEKAKRVLTPNFY
jgi:hypothetical protein